MDDQKLQKDQVVKLLRELSKQIGTMSDEDFDLVISGSFELTARSPKPSKKSNETKSVGSETRQIDVDSVIDSLRSCGAREEAEQLLEASANTKADLKAIAKVLDLPVRKSDQVALIRDRIVDSTVGYRLTSAAIRGSKNSDDAESKKD